MAYGEMIPNLTSIFFKGVETPTSYTLDFFPTEVIWLGPSVWQFNQFPTIPTIGECNFS